MLRRLFCRFLALLLHPFLRPSTLDAHRLPAVGPALVVVNHPTVLDGVLVGLWCPRPIRFLVAGHLFSNPLMGWFFRWMGCIPVGRGGNALQAALEALSQGHVVGIFPEGTMSGRRALLPLHSGVARLALLSGVPVVPLGISGTLSAFPPKARLLRPGRATLALGRPLRFMASRSPSPRRVEGVLRRLRARLERQVARADSALGRAPRPGLAGILMVAPWVVPLTFLLRISEPDVPDRDAARPSRRIAHLTAVPARPAGPAAVDAPAPIGCARQRVSSG